jgi:hypothetical protein
MFPVSDGGRNKKFREVGWNQQDLRKGNGNIGRLT